MADEGWRETMPVAEWERRMRRPFADFETDAQARSIVGRFLEAGEPFVLYLRSFELEAYDLLKPSTPTDSQGRRVGYEAGGPSALERKLADSLDERIVVVAVANPSRTILSANRFPRLRLPDEDWLRVVEWLVRAASFVVVELYSLAPGVRMELQAIERSERRDDTVVVLTKDTWDPVARAMLAGMGFQLPDYPKADRDSPALAGFSRVLQEDDIRLGNLSACPELADLLTAHYRQLDGEATAQTRRRRAELTAMWGMLRIDQHDVDEGLRVLFQAVAGYHELGDRAGVAQVLKEIGEVYLESGQYDDAIQAFRDAGTLGSDHDFRYAACKVAIAHYLRGGHNTAVGYLVAARDQSQAAGDHEIEVYALELLLDIYQRAGEQGSVRRVEEDLELARRSAALSRGRSGLGHDA